MFLCWEQCCEKHRKNKFGCFFLFSWKLTQAFCGLNAYLTYIFNLCLKLKATKVYTMFTVWNWKSIITEFPAMLLLCIFKDQLFISHVRWNNNICITYEVYRIWKKKTYETIVKRMSRRTEYIMQKFKTDRWNEQKI